MHAEKRAGEGEDVTLIEEPGPCCSWKQILLEDVLPASILLILVIGYLLFGGGIFTKLESDAEDGGLITFPKSVEFCVTLLTTIGYGHIVPVTDVGKLVTVFYGIIGIPLFFATMFKIGGILANLIASLLSCCKRSRPIRWRPKHVDDSSCPGNFLAMGLGLLLLLVYFLGTTPIFMGSRLDRDLNVSFIHAFYINFITLSTTGFGDYYPTTFDAGFYMYLFFGLVLVAMNIILVKQFLDDVCSILKRELGLSKL